MTPRQFAQALLLRLNLPVTANNVAALVAAQKLEGGMMANAAAYNPLNTTLKMPGSYAVTPVGVQAYVSWEQGIDATAASLANGLYKDVLADLANNAPPDTTLHDLQMGPWGWYTINKDGTRTPNPIGRASIYQGYADVMFPAGPVIPVMSPSPLTVLAVGAGLTALIVGVGWVSKTAWQALK